MSMSDDQQANPERDASRRRLRRRNLAVLAILLAWVLVIYLVSIVKMSGTT